MSVTEAAVLEQSGVVPHEGAIAGAVIRSISEARRGAHPGRHSTELAQLTELWSKYWNLGGRDERNALVLAYQSVVDVVVARLPYNVRSNWEAADLASFGTLGLIEAIDRFGTGSEVTKFAGYAMLRVRGAIFDELRRLDWLPRTVRRRAIEYRTTAEELAGRLSREAKSDEVLAAMRLSPEARTALGVELQLSQLVRLGAPAPGPDGSDYAPGENLSAEGDSNPEEQLVEQEDRRLLRLAIENLPERQRTVISLRFFGGMTQAQIGEMLGVTNSRVCQIESAALLALRNVIVQ